MVQGDYNAWEEREKGYSMGKVTVVHHDDAEITLSMVKWGIFRRSLLVLGKRLGLINSFSVAAFVPWYEIAIYDGGMASVLSKKPYLIFYYPDTNTP